MEKIIDEKKQGQSLVLEQDKSNKRKLFIESYGCAMNFSDSEIVASVLADVGFSATRNMEESDLILINTCSIREKAEDTVRKRLRIFDKVKRSRPGTMVGVLGCMAERLKKKLLEQEKWELYTEMFNKLSENCKEVLGFYYNKVSYADIVKKLSYTTESVARQRVFKCRKKLSDLVKKDKRFKQLKAI